MVLDPTKQYLLGSPMDDRDVFAKARRYSRSYIQEPDRWTHVAALFCEEDEWQVIECADYTNGVCKRPYWRMRECWRGRIDLFAVEYRWNLTKLHRDIGLPYSARKAVRYAQLSVRPRLPLFADCGTTCSEILACADYGHICESVGIDVWDIVPVHFQQRAIESGLPIECVMRKV